MATGTHHHSFTDHLALYLPQFLRPPLPRDLRPVPTDTAGEVVYAPPVPMSTPLPEEEDQRQVRDGDTATVGGPSLRRSDTQLSHAHHRHESEPDTECDGNMREEEMVGSNVRGMLKEKKEKRDVSKEGYHVSLILTNSGSVARDHLASERTFLAYVRTSLALASTGVALVQLFTIADGSGSLRPAQDRLVRRFATPLGSMMIILGLITLLLGCLRYFAIQMALTRGVFPAARLTVAFLVATLLVLTGVVFGVLVKGRSDMV